MKTLLTATLMAAVLSIPAAAQKLNLDFSALAAKAVEKNEITLDGDMLRLFGKAAADRRADKKDDKGDASAAEKLFGEIQGVSVRNYKFAGTGEYSDRDLGCINR